MTGWKSFLRMVALLVAAAGLTANGAQAHVQMRSPDSIDVPMCGNGLNQVVHIAVGDPVPADTSMETCCGDCMEVMALLPPMLQNLFGYGVIDTGIVLAPRGFGVLFSMQLTSILLRKGVDARPIIAIGFIICAWSLYLMAHWSLSITQFHLISTAILQGLGMGLVFIPLQVMAFSTLPPRLRTDGSSIFNLMRSLGASAGISLMAVMLARNIQTSHADIGSNITPANGDLIDFSTIDQYQVFGDVAVRLADAEINRQAAMVAYIDDFYIMMWMAILTAPLAYLMKRVKMPESGAPMGE